MKSKRDDKKYKCVTEYQMESQLREICLNTDKEIRENFKKYIKNKKYNVKKIFKCLWRGKNIKQNLRILFEFMWKFNLTFPFPLIQTYYLFSHWKKPLLSTEVIYLIHVWYIFPMRYICKTYKTLSLFKIYANNTLYALFFNALFSFNTEFKNISSLIHKNAVFLSTVHSF